METQEKNNLINNNPVFQSFIIAGFECASPKDKNGVRINLLKESQHHLRTREDYHLLIDLGINTVREGLSWGEINFREGVYDFAMYENMMQIAKEERIEQIWDLTHYSYPEWLDPYSDRFVQTFAKYAKKVINLLRKYTDKTIFIVPVNEISFWAYMSGGIGLWEPKEINKGVQFKRQLVKASIAAMEAIWAIDKNVRFIQSEPAIHRIPKNDTDQAVNHLTKAFFDIKFQTLDMLSGRIEPELGGNEKYLDIIGLNYYIDNQEWITCADLNDDTCHQTIPWESKDRVVLGQLLEEAYDRYNRPLMITETGSYKKYREKWWERLFLELDEAMKNIPIKGVCVYPAIDRYGWNENEKDELTHAGLWDFKKGDTTYERRPHRASIDVIINYIKSHENYKRKDNHV